MGILDFIFKLAVDSVSFKDQLFWAFCEYPSKVFDKSVKIYYHYVSYRGGGDAICEYLYNDKYLVYLGGHMLSYINVYLVDETFQYTKDMYVKVHDNFCYPKIIKNCNVVLDGPWINDLKALFNAKGVRQAILKEREESARCRAELERKEQSRKQCCEMKRNSVLDNYRSK